MKLLEYHENKWREMIETDDEICKKLPRNYRQNLLNII